SRPSPRSPACHTTIISLQRKPTSSTVTARVGSALARPNYIRDKARNPQDIQLEKTTCASILQSNYRVLQLSARNSTPSYLNLRKTGDKRIEDAHSWVGSEI